MKWSATSTEGAKHNWRSPAVKIVSIYLVFAGLWILTSDAALRQLTSDPDRTEFWSMIKGWVFVVVTGGLLFGLIQGWFSRLRKSEAKWRVSEERYRSLVTCSPDAMYLHAEDCVTFANPAMCRLIGAKEPAQLLGRSVLEIVHPEFHDLMRARWKRVFAGEPVPTVEAKFIRLDGTVVNVEVSAVMMHSQERQEVQVIARDITERKRAEVALQTSERNYREIFNATNEAIFLHDAATGRVLDVNDSMLSLWGFDSKDELLKLDVGSLSANEPPYTEAEAQLHLRLAIEHKAQEFEWLARKKNGEKFWVEVSLRSSEIGGQGRVLAVVRDITQRKQADEALRLSEEKWRSIVNTSPDGIAIVSMEGTIQSVSGKLLAMQGFESSAELVGRHMFEFLDAAYQEKARRLLQEMLKGNYTGPAEYLLNKKDGTQFFTEINAEVLRDASGTPTNIFFVIRDITERKHVEQSLRENQERLVLAQAVAHVGNWDLDLATQTLWASEESFRIYGLEPTASSALPLAVVQQIPLAEERPRLDAALRDLVAGRQSYNLEFRIARSSDGAVRVISSQAVLKRDAGGAPIKVLGVVQDITERRQAEDQLHLLSRAVEQTPVTVVITNACGNIEYVNPQFTKVTGYTFEEVRGQNPRVLKSGQMPATVYQTLWATIKNGKVWRGVFCNRKKNGELFWEEASIAPVLDAGGRITHFIALKLDITSHRQAENQIRNQARLLDLARDTVVVCNVDGSLNYWNKAFEELTGLKAAEIIGRTLVELLKCDHFELGTALHAVREKGEWTGELEGESRSGRKFTLLSRWSLVRERDTEPERILSINTDVTEKKQIEAQFLRSQRLESIGSLASGIAHDLNNILSPIMLCAPMLNDDLTTAERREMVNLVEESARRASDIVRQLLGFSRGKEGQKVLLQFRHLVREMGKIVTETFPRSIRFEMNFGSNLWPIMGNATQLHQVLLNLCVNARDAMPAGGRLMVAVENIRLDYNFVAMNPEAKIGPFLRMRVSDTGHGIPESIREKIFDPFFTTKPVGQGTGLGLATVFGIVKEHGGFISVQSDVGKGSTFEFYLPALPEEALLDADSTANDPVPRGQGELVLVVDDEPAISAATALALRQHGYDVAQAANGLEALKQFTAAAGRVRLVVSDLSMPLMDGTMLCRALRSLSPATPIIVSSGGLTGPAALDYFRTLGELGITHILNKPHTAEVLLRMMDEILHPDGVLNLTENN